ncbi:hypothetical protein [Streptomyces sp. AM6-12]|uniref:hypothetical protein n=1 Tax=Streptomyces sp. AM6-12 TaxID=3345149 RepID=UPI0037B5CB8A
MIRRLRCRRPAEATSWFALADPAGATSLTITVSALPSADLAGVVQAEGLRQVLTYRCDVREWSTDVAAWMTEVCADSIRAVTGLSGPVLITVSSAI